MIEKHHGYDPYDSWGSRRWLGEFFTTNYGFGTLLGRWEYPDEHHFFDVERPKYLNHVDYERRVSTRPVNPSEWLILDVADMHNPTQPFPL